MLEKPKISDAALVIIPDAQGLVDKGLCPLCRKETGAFRDKVSEKEYSLSGICQDCQDEIFEE